MLAITTCDSCGSENVRATETDTTLAHDIVCDDCGWEFYVPAEVKARTRIAALRKVAAGECGRIDGVLIDVMTGGLLVHMYDALSPANREKFGKVDIGRLGALAWKHAKVGG